MPLQYLTLLSVNWTKLYHIKVSNNDSKYAVVCNWYLFYFLIDDMLIDTVTWQYLCMRVLLTCWLTVWNTNVCRFRMISRFYPHFWTVPASGVAEPSIDLSQCKNFFMVTWYLMLQMLGWQHIHCQPLDIIYCTLYCNEWIVLPYDAELWDYCIHCCHWH